MDAQSLGPVNGPAAAGTAEVAPRPVTSTAGASNVATRANEVVPRDPRTLQYQVDEHTREVVTTIVDSNNKTVVVQIPSEEVLRIAQAIDRMQGFLLQGKA
jgi:flagellar protein FlaG